LLRLAQDTGRRAEQIAQQAVARYVQEDPAFLAAVKKGIDSLDHG